MAFWRPSSVDGPLGRAFSELATLVGHFPNSRRDCTIFDICMIHVCGMFETRVAFVGQFLLLRVCGWVAERIHSASCSSFLPDERSNAACRPHGCERVHCSPKCKKDRFSLISGFHQNEDRRSSGNHPQMPANWTKDTIMPRVPSRHTNCGLRLSVNCLLPCLSLRSCGYVVPQWYRYYQVPVQVLHVLVRTTTSRLL